MLFHFQESSSVVAVLAVGKANQPMVYFVCLIQSNTASGTGIEVALAPCDRETFSYIYVFAISVNDTEQDTNRYVKELAFSV